jgi:hypothetical protein
LRVVLVGDRMIYYLLVAFDPDLPSVTSSCSPISTTTMELGPETLALSRALIATLSAQEGLRPVARDARRARWSNRRHAGRGFARS